jgi:uncharacterized damage-inducible protein DinB
MSWANQGIYKQIAELPDEVLDAFATDPEWTVGEILRHVAFSSGALGARLKGADSVAVDRPKTMKELQAIAVQLQGSDAELLTLADLADEKIAVTRKGETTYFMRSTFITQAIHHATEHRAQAVSALEAKGFKKVNLDDFSVWDHEISER